MAATGEVEKQRRLIRQSLDRCLEDGDERRAVDAYLSRLFKLDEMDRAEPFVDDDVVYLPRKRYEALTGLREDYENLLAQVQTLVERSQAEPTPKVTEVREQDMPIEREEVRKLEVIDNTSEAGRVGKNELDDAPIEKENYVGARTKKRGCCRQRDSHK